MALPIKSPGLLGFFLLHIYSPKKSKTSHQMIWEEMPYLSQVKPALPSVGYATEPEFLDPSAMEGICLLA